MRACIPFPVLGFAYSSPAMSACANELATVPKGKSVGTVFPPKLPRITDELSPDAMVKLRVPKQSSELAKHKA